MVRTRTTFRCAECGAEAPQWLGRCAECGAWDSLGEAPAAAARPPRGAPALAVLPGGEAAAPVPAVLPGGEAAAPVPLAAVSLAGSPVRPSGVPELDRVLGGGFVPGSVTLLGGEPGVGKSTLALQAFAGVVAASGTALLVSGEESADQVRARAGRIGAPPGRVEITTEVHVPRLVETLLERRPGFVVVDSIQTIFDPEVSGLPGSVAQVREAAHLLVRFAKTTATPVVLLGHVTKEGDLAGPRALEHVVDTVLLLEGDRHHALRLLRAAKHRFGATGELGLLEMTGSGLCGVADPSRLFLADRLDGVPGSAVTAVVEGSRPLVVEVQALITAAASTPARRTAQGFDRGRLAMLLAVLGERAGVPTGGCDVYVSVAGGLRVAEPGADLAVALALAGGARRVPLDPATIVLGEVGLGGEVRQVAGVERRLGEARRLGLERAIVPAATPDVEGVDLHRVGRMTEALAVAGLD